MKRFLYVSFGNANTPGRGVSKKINGQIGAFTRKGYICSFLSGFDTGIVVRDHEGIEHHSVKKGASVRGQICDWCIKNAAEFDCVYIRFQFFDLLVLQMLEAFKKNNTKVVMEIPTYPYEDELKIQGIKGKPKLLCDRLYRDKCASYIDRFCCPLYDKPIFGVENIQIRNGIDTSCISVRNAQVNDEGIRLLAVASMSRWHGFERMIEGLHDYYNKGNTRKVIFNVVGEGNELQKYKDLTKQYQLDDVVVFWGRKFGDDLEKAYDESDIGVSSLGMHRLNTEISNPLKTVEYLAKGLPVVCEDGEISISEDSPYRFTVPFDDSNIDINSIVEFYDRLYQGKNVETVIADIRNECEEKCSMDSAMKSVIDFFDSTIERK